MSELHTTTHWRRLRNILNKLFEIENINHIKDKYNFEKITCYRSVGEELQRN